MKQAICHINNIAEAIKNMILILQVFKLIKVKDTQNAVQKYRYGKLNVTQTE